MKPQFTYPPILKSFVVVLALLIFIQARNGEKVSAQVSSVKQAKKQKRSDEEGAGQKVGKKNQVTQSDGRTLFPFAASWRVTDIQGKHYKPFSDKKLKGVVFVFVKDDCPIANALIPELNRLSKDFLRDGVRLFLVYPSISDGKKNIAEHRKLFSIEAPQIDDHEQNIARSLKATVTPEVFLFKADRTQWYQGRINNQYVGYGKKRTRATKNDLTEAVKLMLENKKVPKAKTKSYGCFIHFKKK